MKVLLGMAVALVALLGTTSAEPWFGSEPVAAASFTGSSNSNTGSASRPSVTCASSRGSCQNLHINVVTSVNDQIKEELSASYVYMAMSSFFNQDDQALRGLSKFFADASTEERTHALGLINYLNKRGGQVTFSAIPAPSTTSWASAKAAVDAALALEKAVNSKLLDLHWTAQQVNDPDLQNLLESDYLTEQVEAIKKLSDFSTILGRFGANKVGVHIFDEELHAGKR